MQREDIYAARLGHGRPAGKEGEYRYVCPFCHDPERSFCVNYVNERFICFRGACDKKGTLEFLARHLNLPYEDVPTLSSFAQLRHRLWTVDATEPTIREYEPSVIPDLYQIRPGSIAWNYLIGRGLTPSDIYNNELSLSAEDRGSRIYFPYRDATGRMVFWVARNYLPNARGPKYKNPSEGMKRIIVYRQFSVDRRYPVSVCEGPISAIIAGNAVATYGVKYSQDQVRLLANMGCPLIAAMDGEAFTFSLKIANDLRKYNADVRVAPLPHKKDPADVGRDEYVNRYARDAFSLESGTVEDLRERLVRSDVGMASRFFRAPATTGDLRGRLEKMRA